MSARPVVLVLALVLSTCAVTACRSAVSDPTPTPTHHCTAPGSCTPQQAAKEAQAAKDHAAAEKVIRVSQAEVNRLFRAGGADAPTATLKEVAADPDLSSIMNVLRKFKQDGRIAHGDIKIERVRFETPYPGDKQELWVCENGTSWYTTDQNGKNATDHGIFQSYAVTLTRFGDQWKRTNTEKAVEVDSCNES